MSLLVLNSVQTFLCSKTQFVQKIGVISTDDKSIFILRMNITFIPWKRNKNVNLKKKCKCLFCNAQFQERHAHPCTVHKILHVAVYQPAGANVRPKHLCRPTQVT